MAEPGIPPLVRHCKWCAWFRMQCPACGQRFWNGMWQFVGYSMHYATAHLGIKVFRRLGGG